MSVKIKRVFVFLTPFHVEAMLSIYERKVVESERSLIIKYDIIKEIPFQASHIISVPYKIVDIRKKEFLKFWQVRRVGKLIEDSLSKYSLDQVDELVLGTDKGIYAQFLIDSLKRRSPNLKVVMVDEGTGFYSSKSFRDTVYECIYPVITYILYGKKVESVNPIGSSSYVDISYIRNIERLGYRRESIEYRKFSLRQTKLDIAVGNGKNILFFTIPLGFKQIDDQRKCEILEEILDFCLSHNVRLWIKPHPRENLDYLEKYDKNLFEIIPNHIPGDNIPFEKFDSILNINSSVVISIVEANYPMNRVITLDIPELEGRDFFRSTVLVSLDSEVLINLRQTLIKLLS